MGRCGAIRLRRAAWGLVGAILISAQTTPDVQAATIDPPAIFAATRPAEPFGLIAQPLSNGGLHDKWSRVRRDLDDERVQLALCDGDRERCASPAALRLLAIVDAARNRIGRAKLGEVNRAINLAIRPVSDLVQYGEADIWSSPLHTFSSGVGDCEDYAIAKFLALQLAGISLSDMRLVILRNTQRQDDHAVLTVRLEGRWLTLDNQRMMMVEDANLRHYEPTFVIDQDSVRRYDQSVGPLAAIPGGNADMVSSSAF